MAKNEVIMRFKIQDDGSLKAVGQEATKTGKNLDKTAKGAHSADRQLKGAAQASSNTTKNFSKMSQGIQGTLVPAYATLAASLFAISALFRGLEQAFNWKAQAEGLRMYAEMTGTAMTGLVAQMREATNGVLSFGDAAQAAQIGLAAGLSPSNLKELSEGAKVVSAVLGRDLTDSFNRLIRGVTKAEPELLDELGIVLRLDVATRKFAEANGLVANKLTLAQRRTAVYNETQRQLTENFGRFADKADELTNPFTQLQTALQDVMIGLKDWVLEPLVAIAQFLSDNAEAATLLFAGFAAGVLRSAFPALKNLGQSLTEFGNQSKQNVKRAKKDFQDAANSFKMSSKKMIVSDKVRGREFQKILKKMGIQEKFNNMERVADQKRSLKMMLNNERAKSAKVKVLNKGELAHMRVVYEAMVTSHKSAMSRIVAATNVAGAGITTGLTLPAFLAQGALAGIGRAITALAPAITALGTIMSVAFGAATFFFIGKFIYDMVTTTKKQREEARKSKGEWKAIETTMREIKELQDGLQDPLDAQLQTQKEINNELIKRYKILQGLMPREMLDEGMAKKDKDAIDQWLTSNIAGLINENPEQFSAVFTQFRENIRGPAATNNPNSRANQAYAKGTESLIKTFQKLINDDDPDSLGAFIRSRTFAQQMLDNADATKILADGLDEIRDKGSEAGKGLHDFIDAQRTLEAQYSRELTGKYKPTMADQAIQAFRSMSESLGKTGIGDPLAELKDSGTGRAIGYKEGMTKDQVKTRLNNTADLLDLSKQLTSTVKRRVAYFKDSAKIAGRLGDYHGKQLARQYEITALEHESSTLLAEIAAKKVELLFADEAAKQGAAEDLANMELKLENMLLQTAELKKQADYMLQLRDSMITAFDEAGSKNIADIILGKEGSGKDAILNTIKDTLGAGAGALGKQLMAPITGKVKGLFGIKDPEEERKLVLENHVKDLERVLREHVKAMGGDMTTGTSAIDEIVGKATGTPGGGIMSQILSMFSGGKGGLFSSFLSIFGFGAKGGVVRKYNSGTGPAGAKYVPGTGNRDTVPAMLTPGEIVVPKGKRVGGNYNTTINVNMEGGGDVTTDDETAAAFGQAIQVAVSEEIANQQRPGGLLSPYGGV